MKKIVLGITGSFSTGKTTIASLFRKLGASGIDADRIYHQLIRPPSALHKEIVSAFGAQILKKNKQIDRKKIAKIVFDNKKALGKLIRMSHPAIIRIIQKELFRLKRAKTVKVVVIDAPLLIEAGLIKLVDKLVVVKTSKIKQMARCRKVSNLAESEINKRIKAQLPLQKKAKLADYVIDNDGTIKNTQKQVKQIWKEINQMRT